MKTARRRTRTLAVGTAAAVLALPAAGSAHVQRLRLPLPSPGTVVQDLGKTADSPLSAGGVVTAVTGSAGGIVAGMGTAGHTVDSLVRDVLTGRGGATLPPDTLDQLLAILGTTASPEGDSPGGGAPGTPPTIAGPGVVGGIVDAAAPEPRFQVLSTLRGVHRTGKLRVKVVLNEPGIVVVAGAIRPGHRMEERSKRARRRAVRKHDRRLIKFPAVVLAYRTAGHLTMTVRLGRTARRTLGVSRNGRISFAMIAADVFRNQASMYEKRWLKRR